VWQILEFTGPSSGNEEARRALLLIIAAGVGFAEFMLGDGSNSNLASGKVQQLPVVKKFEDRQELWGHALMQTFQFGLMIKAKFGVSTQLSTETDREGDAVPFAGRVEFPQIAQDKDLEVAQTNELAIAGGYMSKRTAAARLSLDLAREIEHSLNDVEKLGELQEKMVAAGLMQDPTEPTPDEALKADVAKSKAGQADARPRRDRSREPGGARST
jgi:hypothetical protein